MARVALLVTVLAAVAYISQAIPVPENVEDEQLKSKEIFDQIQPESKEILDQVQPESKEILDQVQPESKEILDQNQPKSEEILDQIQPKSEENLDQPDDTSKDEHEDPKNKDWYDHKKNILKQKFEILLEILENENNQWKKKGIERQIERIQRIRRNSQYAPIDIANVNDIKEIFTNQLLPIVKNASSQFKSFIQNELKEIPKVFLPLIENITQLKDQNGISEKFATLFEKFEDYKENISSFIKDKAKDFIKDVVEKVENSAKKIIENVNKNLKQEDIFNELQKEMGFFKSIAESILKNDFNASIKVINNVLDNFKNALKPYLFIPLNIIKFKINEVKQVSTDLITIFVKQAQGIIEESFESGSTILNNILNKAESRRDKIEDKIGELFGNVTKSFDPFNPLKDIGILPKIKRN